MVDLIVSWLLRVCLYGAVICAVVLTVLYIVRDVLTWIANRRDR